MQDDTSTTRSIEAGLEKDRAQLADSMENLRARLSPSGMADEALGYLKGQVGPLTRAADHTIRANPIAALMVGVGAVWLILGSRARTQTPDGEVLAGTKYEALGRWEDEGGNPAPLPEPDLNWVAETDTVYAAAREALGKLDKDQRDKVLAPAEAERRRQSILDGVKRDGNKALRRGLDSLSTAAQDRIAQARETAYLAGCSAARQTAHMIEERPLTAGGIAFAIGATLGALLPATRIEDRVFGAERDRLMQEAEDLLRQETAHATEVLGSFVGTMRQEFTAATQEIVGLKG